MRPTEPLPLYHSWSLLDRSRQFDLGAFLDRPFEMPAKPDAFAQCGRALAAHGIGLWHCDLADESLTWSDGVYDLFGLPRGVRVRREGTVAYYLDRSRAAMETLRSYALKHRRGFTLDAEIMPVGRSNRTIRLVAAPICENGRPVELYGLKIGL